MKRTGWLGFVAAATVAVTLLAGGCARLEVATREVQASFDVAGVVDLEALTANGDVTVLAVPGQTTVEVTATIRSWADTLAKAASRAEQVVVEMTLDDGRVLLEYDPSTHPLDVRLYTGVAFEVTLPPACDAEVRTSNGQAALHGLEGLHRIETSNGAVVATNVVGELYAETSNGRIEIDGFEGVLSLDTSNGRIEIVNAQASVDAETSNGGIVFAGTLAEGVAHRMETSNGSIDVTIQPGLSVRVIAATSNGTISSELPLLGDTAGKEWDAVLNSPAGGTLTLRTSNGDIGIHGGP